MEKIVFAGNWQEAFAKAGLESFDDFFEDKPEPIIEMSGSQCLIVKL